MHTNPPHNNNPAPATVLQDPVAYDLRVWVAQRIERAIGVSGLTQTEAARLMGLKQPDLSAVLHGKLKGYSVERLARCLSALGEEVSITVKGVDGSESSFIVGDS